MATVNAGDTDGLPRHLARLFEALNAIDFLKAVWVSLDKARGSEHYRKFLFGQEYSDAGLADRVYCDEQIILKTGVLRPVIERHVLANISRPYPILIDEIQDVMFQQLSGCCLGEEITTGTIRLLAHLQNRLSLAIAGEPEIGDKDIPLGTWINGDEDSPGVSCVLWKSDTGVELRLDDECRPHPWGLNKYTGSVWGQATRRALEVAEEQLSHLAPSIAETVRLVSAPYEPDNPKHKVLKEFFRNRPAIDELVSDDGQWLFSACCNAAFQNTDREKSHSLDRRVQNAVLLLADADKQSNPTIGLSLCFSAIEALVCENRSAIVMELATRVAALLLPNPIERHDAFERIKKLYNVRSEYLHGAKLEHEEENWRKVRRLGAAVLTAVLQWRRHVEMMGDSPKRPDFLRELDVASHSGQRMVGPDEGLRRLIVE